MTLMPIWNGQLSNWNWTTGGPTLDGRQRLYLTEEARRRRSLRHMRLSGNTHSEKTYARFGSHSSTTYRRQLRCPSTARNPCQPAEAQAAAASHGCRSNRPTPYGRRCRTQAEREQRLGVGPLLPEKPATTSDTDGGRRSSLPRESNRSVHRRTRKTLRDAAACMTSDEILTIHTLPEDAE